MDRWRLVFPPRRPRPSYTPRGWRSTPSRRRSGSRSSRSRGVFSGTSRTIARTTRCTTRSSVESRCARREKIDAHGTSLRGLRAILRHHVDVFRSRRGNAPGNERWRNPGKGEGGGEAEGVVNERAGARNARDRARTLSEVLSKVFFVPKTHAGTDDLKRSIREARGKRRRDGVGSTARLASSRRVVSVRPSKEVFYRPSSPVVDGVGSSAGGSAGSPPVPASYASTWAARSAASASSRALRVSRRLALSSMAALSSSSGKPAQSPMPWRIGGGSSCSLLRRAHVPVRLGLGEEAADVRGVGGVGGGRGRDRARGGRASSANAAAPAATSAARRDDTAGDDEPGSRRTPRRPRRREGGGSRGETRASARAPRTAWARPGRRACWCADRRTSGSRIGSRSSLLTRFRR